MANNPNTRKGSAANRSGVRELGSTNPRSYEQVRPGETTQVAGGNQNSLLTPQRTVHILERSLGARDVEALKAWTGGEVPHVAMMIATRYRRDLTNNHLVPEYGYMILENPSESDAPAMLVRLGSSVPLRPGQRAPRRSLYPLRPPASPEEPAWWIISEPYNNRKVPTVDRIDTMKVELDQDGNYNVSAAPSYTVVEPDGYETELAPTLVVMTPKIEAATDTAIAS